MGPFELMDLVGVDVGFEIAKSFFEQSFGEPRWRPSPITARYVAAGMLGRKAGRGFYEYPQGGEHRRPDPERLAAAATPASGEGVVVIAGESRLADELRQAATLAGYEVRGPHTPPEGVLPALSIDCDAADPDDGWTPEIALPPPVTGAWAAQMGGRPLQADAGATEERPPLGERSAPGSVHHLPRHAGGAHLVLCARGSLATLDPGGSAVGFFALAPFEHVSLVELTRSASSSPLAAARAERFFTALGRHVEWVKDAPGLVLGRIVCQLINEAAFALGEGVGGADDIDTGMVLGLNHPRGPLEWGETIGWARVLDVLDALWREYREERYRPAPALRRLAAGEQLSRGDLT